ncbi:transcriptional regulator FilR1 domain-containing protein [Methanolobus sp.]|uniref:helix-turn-helix transcriptional regulator n=1 Tax=Methanolobus sp. TaxID=1874737 RepID=UPI0025E452F1|nr:transcriptional regulator FilR1 domain-containing protein [Methanolobus sp.]
MKKITTDVLLASDKRKKVLLLLQDNPKEMEILLEALDTTRTALLPQMKILKEANLISKDKKEDRYELTTVGKMIVEEMASFLRTVETFGINSEYLATHYIDFIPSHLLKKLPELGSFHVADIPMSNFFEADTDFFERAITSNSWLEIASVLHPTFHEFYVKMTEYATEVSVILNKDAYEKAKQDYYKELRELIDLDLISLYVYPENLGFGSFIMTGESFQFRLLTKKGILDSRKMIISGQGSCEWGTEFFENYKNLSTSVIDL